jgi:medium-chain acyl-[acyl-carrier-protein] hydrolase
MAEGSMKPPSFATDTWLRCYLPRPAAQLRLFCLPYAGGGASIYRTWGQHLPPSIEVCAIQLPGHEDRMREAPYTRLHDLIEGLTPAILPYLDRPFALFGHSLGALLSYALTCRLRELAAPLPVHLFISSRTAPHWQSHLPELHRLPDREFLTQLQDRYGGVPPEIWQEAELRELLLPIIRADLTVFETYNYQPAPPLPCPIAVFAGLQDRHLAQDGLAAWRDLTKAAFTVQMFAGDHFYVKQRTQPLLHAVRQCLAADPKTIG